MTKIPNPEQQDQGDPEHQEDNGEGQVTEVSTMAGADEPIQPDQSVAGSPNDDPAGADEGAQGPNANPNAGARKT